MNTHPFSFAGASLAALPSGALWWQDEGLLVVSDLHLGKSDRIARRGGALLPPYEVEDTLERLSSDLVKTNPSRVICLGDSFDDLAAGRDLSAAARNTLAGMIAGRDWIWAEGNHDPGPLDLGGSHRAEVPVGDLVFRHIALAGATAEVSGHYHPKTTVSARGRRVTRPCFLHDQDKLILPAYGTYTGGLKSKDPAIAALFPEGATAILTGPVPCAVPMQTPERA